MDGGGSGVVPGPSGGVWDRNMSPMSCEPVRFPRGSAGQPLVWDMYADRAAERTARESLRMVARSSLLGSYPASVSWDTIPEGNIPSIRAAGRMAGCLESCVPHTERGLSRNQARAWCGSVGLIGWEEYTSMPAGYSHEGGKYSTPSGALGMWETRRSSLSWSMGGEV